MRNTPRHAVLASAMLIALLGSTAHAAIIASTDFAGTTKSAASQTMTDVTWTGDDLLAVTPSDSVTTTASNNAGYFTTGFGANGFAPDQNIENEGPWTADFNLTFNGGATGNLTQIDFDYAGLTNSGASQGTNFRAQNFDVSVNGTTYEVQKQTTAVNGSLTFTDAAPLNSGVNQISITSSEVSGPGYNMGIDNLSFMGDVTPAPVIASTNFDGATKSAASQTMTSIMWTGDDLVSVTPLTAITTAANANTGYFTTGFGATGFAPDQNIENEGPWSATIDLMLNSGATASLTQISFDYTALTNSGSVQSGFRAQNFDVLVNGIPYEAQQQTTAISGTLGFNDVALLTSGLNQITITASEVNGPGYNMGIDNLVFRGFVTPAAPIPEPGAMVLLGACLLGVVAYRRRSQAGGE